jgi:hypothetical protein
MVAHAYNLSYMGDGDQEDQGWRSAQAKNYWDSNKLGVLVHATWEVQVTVS